MTGQRRIWNTVCWIQFSLVVDCKMKKNRRRKGRCSLVLYFQIVCHLDRDWVLVWHINLSSLTYNYRDQIHADTSKFQPMKHHHVKRKSTWILFCFTGPPRCKCNAGVTVLQRIQIELVVACIIQLNQCNAIAMSSHEFMRNVFLST